MSKSVLVIDTPACCGDCPFAEAYHDVIGFTWRFCNRLEEQLKQDYKESRHPNCPLKPLPIKRGKLTLTERSQSNKMLMYALDNNIYSDGWNDCIDEITGGENERKSDTDN